MDLSGMMVREVEIKSDGDLFYEFYRYRPHELASISPSNVQKVDLNEGDWGNIGCVMIWHFNHDGKVKTSKSTVEAIDEQKKSVTFNNVEGDHTQRYKTFKITVQVDKKGENNLVTWTLEYEKLSGDVEDPNTFMDLLIVVTKDIEAHHLK